MTAITDNGGNVISYEMICHNKTKGYILTLVGDSRKIPDGFLPDSFGA